MSPVCAADQLVPHLGYCGSSYAAGVAGLAALALASPPKTRRSTTIRATLEPHATNKPWQAQRAAVLAIGTANPANSMPQDEYADWYFRITNSDHLHQLKDKMKRICRSSKIKKRHFHHTEDTFRDHPELIDSALPSLSARQALLASAIPELAAAAAAKAIAEWGRPASEVTHLIFATYLGAHFPGADLRLASLLGLPRTARRTMLYLGGCAAGAAALRLAKDVAVSNSDGGGARVLVVCADLSLILFRAPRADALVAQALFGDGAAAAIVGAGGSTERPIFEMVAAAQTSVLSSEDAVAGYLGEDGVALRITPKMPALVRQHAEQWLADAVAPLGIGGGWNDLFWAVHPGGPAILDAVEDELALDPGKLDASRHVLRDYGNMSGATVLFVLDELRRRPDVMEGGLGVMLGIGPGISVETMVLRAIRHGDKQ